MSARLLVVAALGAALSLVRPLVAQDTAIVIHPESAGLHLTPPELPHAVVTQAVQFYNAPTTTHLVGRVRLPAGNTWAGNVAIRNGPAFIAGTVDGTLLILNGTITLDATARITGDLIVIGGTLLGVREAVAGSVFLHAEPLPYRLVGDTLIHAPDLARRFSLAARYIFGRGSSRSSLVLATGGTYNRVEGLPIVAGPTVDVTLGHGVALRGSAMGVFRTARSISGECCDLGYNTRLELRLGDRRPVTLALRAFDLVTPVEDWGLHSNEVGWEAFFVRRDYRDYYRDNGVGVRLGWQAEAPLALGVELRRERQATLAARDPWTLSRTGRPWRPNPPADNGHYTTVSPGVTFDTRNDRSQPTSGWYLRATFDVISSHDARPAPGIPSAVRDSTTLLGAYRSTRAFLDFRRYNRLSAQGRLNLRLVLAGWTGGDPLPLQKRLSIGGPEPLPGYDFRQGACNALVTDAVYAGTNVALCDRVVIVQAEYRGHVSLRTHYNPETGEGEGVGYVTRFLSGPDFVVFGDAGQAWLVGTGPGRVSSGRLPGLDSWQADFGLGVDWGGFGVYLAKAVTAGQPVRLTARLEHRF
ncbi:MAG TPA: BamA/TamA family outer membrane protein [Gemmatimonadales bacterium]